MKKPNYELVVANINNIKSNEKVKKTITHIYSGLNQINQKVEEVSEIKYVANLNKYQKTLIGMVAAMTLYHFVGLLSLFVLTPIFLLGAIERGKKRGNVAHKDDEVQVLHPKKAEKDNIASPPVETTASSIEDIKEMAGGKLKMDAFVEFINKKISAEHKTERSPGDFPLKAFKSNGAGKAVSLISIIPRAAKKMSKQELEKIFSKYMEVVKSVSEVDGVDEANFDLEVHTLGQLSAPAVEYSQEKHILVVTY